MSYLDTLLFGVYPYLAGAVFLLGSLVSRAISFMIVGLLFQFFGAPIKRFIDKYLGLVTAAFIAAVIAAILAATGRNQLKHVKGMPRTVETAKKVPDALKGNEDQS